jgi:hypothetical protein
VVMKNYRLQTFLDKAIRAIPEHETERRDDLSYFYNWVDGTPEGASPPDEGVARTLNEHIGNPRTDWQKKMKKL